MKLYYAPGACSLAAHIVLRELALPFRLVAVSLKRQTTADGEDFRIVNPKGYVPVLGLDDGSVLTEGPAILQYLADLRPELGLAPANGTLARYRLQEWLGFLNSEVHKPFGPLFHAAGSDEARVGARAALTRRFEWIAAGLTTPYLMGAAFTVADAYLYTVLTWTAHVGPALEAWPALADYRTRLATRPAIRDAHAAERTRTP
jgi:glutathione S-transferase